LYKPNEDDLQRNGELYLTNEKHMTLGNNNGPIEYTTNTNKVNDDGNSVDVTTQMVELMKVSQKQSIAFNAISTQYGILNAARGK